MDKKMKIGEIIWAKIRGFPWWPGKIGRIVESDCPNQETKILVNFIGDSSHADIPISKIEKFDRKFEEFSKTKKKNLINAINLASKLIKEENTINNGANNGNFRKPSDKILNKRKEDKNSNDSESSNEDKRINFLNKKRLRKSKLSIENKENVNAINQRIRINSKSGVKRKEIDTVNTSKPKRQRIIHKSSRKRQKNLKVLKEKNDSNSSLCDDSIDGSDASENEGSGNDSYSSSPKSNSQSASAELIDKVHELVFSKIEMPSSSSNKSILGSLDYIEALINKINPDELYDLTRDLFPYLSCLFRNKNPSISSKAFSLSNTLQTAITKNLFLSYAKLSDLSCSYKNSTTDLPETLAAALEAEKTHINKESSKIIKNKIKKMKKNEPKELTVNPSLSLRLLKSNLCPLEEEIHSMSEEISLDSHKTDCEESKSNYKIQIIPIDRSGLVLILKDYFVDSVQSESEFFCKLFKGEYFYCPNEEKTTKLIKNHYMRKRVCYKLFKVFEKLLSKEELENKFLKDLSIFLEFKAREKDPEMAEKYKKFISHIFHKIKEELVSINIPV